MPQQTLPRTNLRGANLKKSPCKLVTWLSWTSTGVFYWPPLKSMGNRLDVASIELVLCKYRNISMLWDTLYDQRYCWWGRGRGVGTPDLGSLSQVSPVMAATSVIYNRVILKSDFEEQKYRVVFLTSPPWIWLSPNPFIKSHTLTFFLQFYY